jgi:hypothetical protein
MPIDPSIALSYRGITAPNPLNQLSQVAQIQNAQQANQLNQLKIQQAQQEIEDTKALANAAKGLDLTTTEGQDAYGRALLSSGNIAEFQKFTTARATQQKAEREATTAQLNNAVAKTKLYNEGLTNVSDPQSLFNWYSQQSVDPHMQGSPVYGMKQEDIQKEILSNSFTQQKDGSVIFDPKKFDDYKTKLQLGTKDYLDNLETHRHNIATEENQRAQERRLSAAGTSGAPTKLNKGEIWNPIVERVENVRGSAADIKQSQLHGTDYDAVNTVKETTKANVENIDALLKAANAWAAETNNGAKALGSNASDDAKAFVSLFPGSYTGYLTQYKSGSTASLKAKYDKLQANSKGLGLGKMRVGGSIGQITEREWPMLQQQVLSLSPTMETADAAAEIAGIKNRFINAETQAVDKYDTTWGDTQYYKGGAAQTPPAGGTAQTPPTYEDPAKEARYQAYKAQSGKK